MKRNRVKYAGTFLLIILLYKLINFLGVFDHIRELDFESEFDYPLNVDLAPLMKQFIQNLPLDISPINTYDYPFITTCRHKCRRKDRGNLQLMLLVKSAGINFDRRLAIRQTWGRETIAVRCVFILGRSDSHTETRIHTESQQYNDIIQIDFVDTYFNNTIKTMLGFKWAYRYCAFAHNYMFSDDDMYISIKNVMRFLRSPTSYPKHIDLYLESLDGAMLESKRKRSIENYLAEDANSSTSEALGEVFLRDRRSLPPTHQGELNTSGEVFFSGFVFKSSPHRHYSSKWRVSLEEYPWSVWPPYVTAGAYVVSNQALKLMYAASLFVKHFKFDDIYLGIIAKKIGIQPFHCEEFYFNKKSYSVMNYRFVIASHGYHDPKELKKVWNEQKKFGNV